MFLLTIILLIVILLGGLCRLLLALTSKFQALSPVQRTIEKQKLRMIGVANILGGGIGMYFLLGRSYEPLDTLIGVMLITGLMEIVIRNKTPKTEADLR